MNVPAGPTATVEHGEARGAPVLCPFGISVERISAFLNAELPDHPVYDGLELQRFDDDEHGRGMLVFLSRRDDRRVDYYVHADLRLDRATYRIGGGIGAWVETDFDAARLEVSFEGVDAEVRFRDVDGRSIELRFDDRAAGRTRRGVLLAPVSAGVDRPGSLMLVYVHGFDLLRRVGSEPVVRIAGEDVSTGRLPAARLHRRHLVKYGAPLTVATICRNHDGPLPSVTSSTGEVSLADDDRSIASVGAVEGGGGARLVFEPPVPFLTGLAVGRLATGAWRAEVDDVAITGGTWHALRRPGDHVELGLEVTERWRPPPGLPPLVWLVTRLVPTFRRWPTTYRWRAELALGADGPTMISRWERTGEATRGSDYRRLTQR